MNFWFELHAIVFSVLIFWCTLEKSWISELTRGLQTLATSWQITKHIDLHPPSQLELDAHLPRPSSPHVLEWNLHVKKCKLLTIRFCMTGNRVSQGNYCALYITFLHLQHVYLYHINGRGWCALLKNTVVTAGLSSPQEGGEFFYHNACSTASMTRPSLPHWQGENLIQSIHFVRNNIGWGRDKAIEGSTVTAKGLYQCTVPVILAISSLRSL